jgi:hypothetical protein
VAGPRRAEDGADIPRAGAEAAVAPNSPDDAELGLCDVLLAAYDAGWK